ncbi:hypothetical protein BDV95DRAFT_20510 [Massariosphaeria phaeospora]|uniref:Uncharacterized protein n=1 Tax=Massariosphaeria phaeospora TaxID=100035 RepID=A0A7C8MYX4_9PLEO|nr:hypothetical protein BDV95DRAFT_20510 [Massariosphaeria phaeospora]
MARPNRDRNYKTSQETSRNEIQHTPTQKHAHNDDDDPTPRRSKRIATTLTTNSDYPHTTRHPYPIEHLEIFACYLWVETWLLHKNYQRNHKAKITDLKLREVIIKANVWRFRLEWAALTRLLVVARAMVKKHREYGGFNVEEEWGTWGEAIGAQL